ncbi:zinc finger Ran-binding domain-containing protein [Rubritalea sp.]|uniref:zinc finger Ran-binding domain-containing protein n=1 Tax=Rubritalea sp. TaxID=2109375 RepID=UPI003EF0DF40
MSWECKKCDAFNPDTRNECMVCKADKAGNGGIETAKPKVKADDRVFHLHNKARGQDSGDPFTLETAIQWVGYGSIGVSVLLFVFTIGDSFSSAISVLVPGAVSGMLLLAVSKGLVLLAEIAKNTGRR